MINISHPRTYNKPPFKKYVPPKHAKDEVKSYRNEISTVAVVENVDRKNHDSNIGADQLILEDAKGNDYNQNVIQTTASSFEQLCSLINDLEKNISHEIPTNEHPQLEPEKDNSKVTGGLNGTTYDDIMSFLGKIEDGSLHERNIDIPQVDCLVLEEIFGTIRSSSRINNNSCNKIESHVSHAFKEDLAIAKLYIEEKDAALAMLKDQLREERKSACEKLEAQKKNNTLKSEAQEEKYKGIVRRHQKFIEQLISEKADLTEKCNSLAQRIKEMEIKVQRDLKTAADRHLVELQRAKEHYAAAEKVRRERWIEARTSKIKEMTIKGLEPELKHMVEQHEEELQNLRNAHMKELQDTELRIMRRSNQQLEHLRLELTASHEKMLSEEKNILWCRYMNNLSEQEVQFKAQQAKLADELQNERVALNEELAKRNAEKEDILRQTNAQCQQAINAVRQQCLSEKKTFEETIKVQFESRLAEYQKQQFTKFQQTEIKLREECNMERDRKIELAINRLEKDTQNMKTSLEQNFESKLRLLKEKYEMDLQAAIDSEKLHKDKFLRTKDKLEESEVELQQVKIKLQEYTDNLNRVKEVIGRLTTEKDNAKKLARQELEIEKRELEEKIASLYREITQNNIDRDASMAQLHSRIKLIMTQKMLSIKNLEKELNEAKQRSQHLEKILDQQRKEYILRNL